MKNDRLIKKLIDNDLLCACPETGQIYYKGNPTGRPQKGTGYITFRVRRKGITRRLRCHRIVWIFVTGKLPKYGMEVNHVDTVKDHNWWKNLELTTSAENIHHAHANGCCDNWESRRDPATGKFVSQMAEAPF